MFLVFLLIRVPIFNVIAITVFFPKISREERGEEGEWEGGGRTKKRGPTFPLLPHSSHSLSSPRSSLKKTKTKFYI
jgi:hypothetical protein